MARVAGVELPKNKRMEIALTYIYGIGGASANKILDKAGVDRARKTDDLSAEEQARMLQAEDLGHTIRFVAEMPPRVCLNEIVISPTWNRMWLGGEDITPKR